MGKIFTPFRWGLMVGAVCGIWFIFIHQNFLHMSGTPLQSEAKNNLGAIFTTQISYFAETNTYASGPHCFDLLKWSPEGINKYAYYCGDDVIENRKGGDCPRPDIETGADARGFTIMAVGNIDRDPACDVWTMNDAKVLWNVVNDPSQ